MNIERLTTLSAHLKTRPPSSFNLDSWFDDELTLAGLELDIEPACRTCACIGGEALFLFAPHEKINIEQVRERAQDLLDLSTSQAFGLFMPNEHDDLIDPDRYDVLPEGRSRSSITPQEAARVVDHLIETGDVDWSIIR